MPSALDFKARVLFERRTTPATLRCALRQRRRHIDPRQRVGTCGNRVTPLHDMRNQFFQMRRLRRQRMATRLGNADRLLMQFGRIEAHCPRHCLPMSKAGAGGH